jgi:hypothetical protein
MSSRLTTALLGSAIVAASVSGVAFAQDSTTKVKPCLGELCPPKSPREDMPKQTMEGANQAAQMQGQDQSSGQVMPRKKKQASFDRNRQQQSSGQVMPRKKKQASFDRNRQQQQPSKKAASRSNFWDWLF